ncbi:hypothetical protein TNCV_4502271 [Trichonephila clavipes]|nr:hypothetical protein TNCV_4502271 [Trichonephila clavipes]
MLRSSGQFGVNLPVFSSQASLVQIYQPIEGDERLSQSCPVRVLNVGPVVWKSDELPLSHWTYGGQMTNEIC